MTRLSFRLHVLPEEFETTCARLCRELNSEDGQAGEGVAPPATQGGAEAGRQAQPGAYGAPPAERTGKAAYAAQAVA